MANIRVLNNISLFNSITATSGIQANTLTIKSDATANTISVGGAPLNGYNLAVSGDAFISGSLTVTGSATFRNTNYSTTSAISVTNTGTGPGLVVSQTGDEAVAAFYDDSNVALYIDGRNARAGNVGVNTATPNEKLTVVGNISATGVVYATGMLNKFVSAFGNGLSSSFVINHNLGVRDVVVSVVDNITQEVVYPSVTYTAMNQITLEFSEAPAITAYKAIVIG